MYPRLIEPRLAASLADTPVVLLNGARQTGKTTLARSVAQARGGQYVTLDDSTTLAAARADPAAFLDGLAGFAVIDEVQHAPDLFPAIKLRVDRQRRPGQLLLTGSANVLTLPRLSESLAGRMEIVSLFPLAQVELAGGSRNLVDRLFSLQSFGLAKAIQADSMLIPRIVRGGFPEAVDRKDDARRAAWFDAYVTTILQRDVRELANIDRLADLPRLLQLVAARSSSLLSYTDLASAMGVPQSTLKRYLTLLEGVFLTRRLPAWSTNRGHRLIKSPKLHVVDSGLSSHLLGLDAARLARPHALGPLLESFVVGELERLAAASRTRVALYHYRSLVQREVDVVLESADGRVIGIEVKSATQVDARDFAGLKALAEDAGDRFAYGIVLHGSDSVVSFGNALQAAPISLLWRAA
jgi:predicted AAA+ superfamily ATPase